MSPGIRRSAMLLYVTCVTTVYCVAVLERGWFPLCRTARIAGARPGCLSSPRAFSGRDHAAERRLWPAVAGACASALGRSRHTRSSKRDRARPPRRSHRLVVEKGRRGEGAGGGGKRRPACGSLSAREGRGRCPKMQGPTGPFGPVGPCLTTRARYCPQAESVPAPPAVMRRRAIAWPVEYAGSRALT
jgi:hypothetical protein